MRRTHLMINLILLFTISACSVFQPGNATTSQTASGIIADTHGQVAPEISGKVVSINIAEGDSVKAGDVLFRLDDQLLQAQRSQAQAAVDLANSSLKAANAQLQSAQAQNNLTLQTVQQQNTPGRISAWKAPAESAFDLPNWYFENDELTAAAQVELDAARQALDAEMANLANELKKASTQDFAAVEKRLAQAQIAYQVAQSTFDQAQAQAATGNEDLKKAAQDNLDMATNELKAAQVVYKNMLSSTAAGSVLEARGRVSTAQARLDNAQDKLTSLQTGEQSLQLKVANAGVKQAEAAVTQAQGSITQAKAALSLIDLQIEKCTIKAAFDGVISARNLELGELAAAGGTVMTISQLNPVNLTVYIPEDRYGQVQLGQGVTITVDSYPNEKFTGKVQSISSEAEFTPRDVQTVDGRKATVYAVKIQVPNDKQQLKAGMPADVTFNK